MPFQYLEHPSGIKHFLLVFAVMNRGIRGEMGKRFGGRCMERGKSKISSQKKFLSLFLLLFLFIYISTIVYHERKPLPKGVSYEGEVHHVSEESISFLYDLTYQKDGEEIQEHSLFNHIFQMIDEADQFIVLDFFLYNDYYDQELSFPPLSSELTTKLIKKKKENPEVEIVLITDEINTSYRSHRNWQFEELKKNEIEVLLTDVDPLRDSNPLYSAGWRMFVQWFGQEGRGRVPNVMANQAPNMTVRSYLKLLNVKANHRKTVATDKAAMILSGNPHDASANHSNIGFAMNGPIIEDLLKSEQAAADLAGGKELLPHYEGNDYSAGDVAIQLLTEGKVSKATLDAIKGTRRGDEIWLAMFYLAERKVIEALLDARDRGVEIKLILDPNENAFGTKKTGLPNRPVARELNEKTEGEIEIRWYNTTKEQYHPKLLYIKKQDGEAIAIGGSTNFTTRNMDDFNLETNVMITAPKEAKVIEDIDQFFHRQWENKNGEFTVDFKEYQNEILTPMQRIIYTLQKWLYFTTY